jgi:molybdate transport system ATP-binding protein
MGVPMSFEISVRHRVGGCKLAVNLASEAACIAVTGPSGAGKTTLLNCIAGLITPDRGRIVIGGRVLLDSSKAISIPIEQRGAGYVFQDARLFPHLKVAANLAYGERLSGPSERRADRTQIIDVLGIAALMERWPANLSGGEVRRVAIARALLAGPRFLLLDEPLASLDQPRGEEILTMIEQLGSVLGIPMIYVSHRPQETARLTNTIVQLG